MRILNDKEILEISQITRDNIEAGDDGYLTTRCNIAKAQHELDLKEFVGWIERVPPGELPFHGDMKHYIISVEQWENIKVKWQSLKQLVEE